MARIRVEGRRLQGAAVAALLLATAALLAAASPARAASPATPIVSGLPWRSGAKLGQCLAAMRGRPLDANHIFITHDSFPAMVAQSGKHWARVEARKAPLWVVSLPLLPSPNRGQFSRCAAGAFDASWRAIGARLAAADARGTVVRLGWEANIGSRRHPWGVDRADQVASYKACWRRAARAIKAGGHGGLLLEWTSAKKTQNRAFTAADMYPGSDVVDVIGVHQYDAGPQKVTPAIWREYYRKTYNGGPWGLGTWLAFARAHGKRLAVSEWAVWKTAGNRRPDNPVYVASMHAFFRANAPSIAYESYLNSIQAEHVLCPATRFPRSAAAYRRLWGKG